MKKLIFAFLAFSFGAFSAIAQSPQGAETFSKPQLSQSPQVAETSPEPQSQSQILSEPQSPETSSEPQLPPDTRPSAEPQLPPDVQPSQEPAEPRLSTWEPVSVPASATFGQKQPRAFSDNHPLLILGNRRYYIGGVRVSREEALRYVAPYDDVADQIRRGARLRQAAIWCGVGGLAVMYAGFGFGVESGSRDGLAIGLTFAMAGYAAAWTGFGLGMASLVAQKKAMRLYNGHVYRKSPPVDLSLGITPGGMGLRLTF